MDTREKLNLLGEAARYDDCSASAPDVIAAGRGFFAPQPDAPPPDPRVLPCVSHLHTPAAQRKATLKVLQTSAVPERLPLLRVPRGPRHPPRPPDAGRAGAQLRPDVPRRVGGEPVPQLRRDGHDPDDGRDAGNRGIGPGQVQFPRLHPPEATARRRRCAHRTSHPTGRPRLGQPGGADAGGPGPACAAETDGCPGRAAAHRGGDYPQRPHPQPLSW